MDAGATDDQMDNGSRKKESWEAYIKWLSTAEFGDNDESHSGSEEKGSSDEKDACDGEAASFGGSQPDKSPTRDRESPENFNGDEIAASGRKRKSRWEPLSGCEGDRPYTPKKRSGWSPEKPSSVRSNFRDIKKLSLHMDSEFLELKIKLADINKKLRTGQVLDDKNLSRFRSPSPEPIYDNFGNRINSRENRAREKLNQERQRILDRLAKKGPPLNIILNHKLSTKVYIPPPRYPEYNPVGLILGPQGVTQQRIEKETAAKLYIRGKATGNAVTPHTTPTEDEKLHVQIEAESEVSLNMAARMVRKLLFPVGGGQSELTLGQLASQANETCNYCKRLGHYKNECPFLKARKSALNTHSATHLKGGNGALGLKTHSNSAFPGTKGGTQTLPRTGVDLALNEDYNRTHIDIEHLPLSINESGLLSLFLPFGQITHVKVFRNQSTGVSKGYGFVRFVKAADASRAVSAMDGYSFDHKILEVKLKNSSEAATVGSLSSSVSHQKSQEKLVGSSALHPHAVLPTSRAAQVSTPSSALQGMGPSGGPLATSGGLEAHVGSSRFLPSDNAHQSQKQPSVAGQVPPPRSGLQGMGPLAISSGLEENLGASRFLPLNRNEQQSQKQSNPSSATQAGIGASYLHYDYSPSQIQPYFSSATQRGVAGPYPVSSYDYQLPQLQPVSSIATETGLSRFYQSGNINIKPHLKQHSATEGGLQLQQSFEQSTPSVAPYANSASPPTGVPTRNGTTLPPANPFAHAAKFFGRFMIASDGAASVPTPSHSPCNPDQHQLHKHSGTAGAIQDRRVPFQWNISARPFNPLDW